MCHEGSFDGADSKDEAGFAQKQASDKSIYCFSDSVAFPQCQSAQPFSHQKMLVGFVIRLPRRIKGEIYRILKDHNKVRAPERKMPQHIALLDPCPRLYIVLEVH